MKHPKAAILLLAITIPALYAQQPKSAKNAAANKTATEAKAETESEEFLDTDTLTHPHPPMLLTVERLTERDYIEVANRLGVEPEAIKAVVDIEAGKEHRGFFKPGLPLINFDLTMFRKFAGKSGINLAKYNRTHAAVFNRPNARAHGSTQAAQQHRLRTARSIDDETAVMGTFWGMFQIGGFNWKLCGAKDIDDFVDRMSRSERDQLELFANFLVSTGLDQPLKAKNWAAFARGYNGPSYARRGYHTRMAAAYARHKRASRNLSGFPTELSLGIKEDVDFTPMSLDSIN